MSANAHNQISWDYKNNFTNLGQEVVAILTSLPAKKFEI